MQKAETHPQSEQLVASARGWIGTRFRPQGRGVEGLDCLGLVLACCRSVGIEINLPPFPLRGMRICEAEERFAAAGCRLQAVAGCGDVLLASPASRQVHLAISTGTGVIEAHAGIGRVVERRSGGDEKWASVWRLPMGVD